jgi:MFS-type transporter involved in bile tolerance (Atg22 family)
MTGDSKLARVQATLPLHFSGIVERLGLDRPELRAWALYDWANSAVVTTIIAAVFPIYFYRVAGAGLPKGVGTRRFAIATLVAMVALAFMAPVLGALPCTVLFGALTGKLGTKPAIFLGLSVYLGIAILGYVMRSEAQFLILAILVGMVQGGTQALSRSLFASLIPKHKSAQFFSLFALSEKVAGVLGPGLFVVTIAVTGSSRYAIVSVVLFFLIGGFLLSRVDVVRGRNAVREA